MACDEKDKRWMGGGKGLTRLSELGAHCLAIDKDSHRRISHKDVRPITVAPGDFLESWDNLTKVQVQALMSHVSIVAVAVMVYTV